MRTQLLEDATSARQARKLAPWAAVIIKVEGGYLAFESAEEARIWRRQK
jgi:hypothetical protein